MIYFVVPAAHRRLIQEYLELWGRDVASRVEIVHTETLPTRRELARGTYVLAAIDQYSSGMAALVAAIHRQLSEREGIRFLNHPSHTLQRFDLLDTMHRSGRNDFRAVRVTDDWRSLRYPVFVRDSGSHDGALSPLLRTPLDVERAIGQALVQGRQLRRLMVVEFCDTADSTGAYRKYSAFVVGRHIVPRYLSISREWMLKFQGSEFTPRMAEEERDYVLTNPHETELRDIFALARVDYGRIDYAMKDGRLQTWEINLNPTIGRGLRASSGRVPPELEAIRKPTKEHFYARFREAWEDIDAPVNDTRPIELSIDPALATAAAAGYAAIDGWLSTVRNILRPAKPIIEPIVNRALPLIARAATRRR
jgi:hypothetical protein